jgi:hypothetical protein
MMLFSVMHVNGLRLTLHVSVNRIIKFIHTLCKCLIFIYVCVSANVEHKKSKCKKPCKHILCRVKQCRKCNFYSIRGRGGGGGGGV